MIAALQKQLTEDPVEPGLDPISISITDASKAYFGLTWAQLCKLIDLEVCRKCNFFFYDYRLLNKIKMPKLSKPVTPLDDPEIILRAVKVGPYARIPKRFITATEEERLNFTQADIHEWWQVSLSLMRD